MLTESLHEFLTLAEYLNITKASQVMHMSQSTLSRHITALESELGYQLFTRENNKLVLTPAGQLFADRTDLVLAQLNAIIDECKVISEQGVRILTVLDPPYQDEAAGLFFTALRRASEANPSLNFNYITFYRKNMHEALKTGDLDITIFYRYGDTEEALETIRNSGLAARWLGSEKLSVFFDRNSPLAAFDYVPVEELARYPILAANDLYRPLGAAIQGLFAAFQRTPTFKLAHTQNQTEFLQYRCESAVYIMPSGMVGDPRIHTRFDLSSRPIGDQNCRIDFFIVAGNRPVPIEVLNYVEN